jgi:site-specific DNA recombinase
MTTVLYLRESKDDELGIERHRADLVALAERNGWTVADEYVDNAESANRDKRRGKPRPRYAAMLADAEAGKISRILCWQIDRLVRDVREGEDVIDLCTGHDVELWTRDGRIDLSTNAGRTPFRLLGAVARGEVEQKSLRHKAAMVQRASMGAAWWPTRPFGYTLADDSILAARTKRVYRDGEFIERAPQWASGAGAEIVLARREAAALKKAYSDVLAGVSLKAIARQWNSAGLLTPKGKEWTGMAVRQQLLAARNAGLRTYAPRDKNGKTPSKTVMPEVVGKGDWPAIVTEQVWRQVWGKLNDASRRTNGVAFSARKYLLSSLAKCSECGKTLSAISDATRTGKPKYVCKNTGCLKVKRTVADVDAWVTEVVLARLADSDPAELLGRGRDVDTVALIDQANVLRARQDELAALFAVGTVTASQLATGTAALDEQIAKVQTQLHAATASHELDGLIGAADVRTKFEGLPIDRKRAVINRLVTVAVKPGQHSRRPFDRSLVEVLPKTA